MALANAYTQLFAAIVIAIILAGNYYSRSFDRNRSMLLFSGMLCFGILMLFAGGLDNYLLAAGTDTAGSGWLHKLLAGLSDCSYFFVLGMFIVYIDTYARRADYKICFAARAGAAVSVVFGLFWFLSGFFGLIYAQDANAVTAGPLYLVGQAGGYITGLLSVYILLRRRRDYTRGEFAGFSLFILVPLIGSLFKRFFDGLTIMPLLIAFSLIIIHCFVQVINDLKMEKQQTALSKMQTDLLMSRMKPHFVYNVLNTIYVLCDHSPQQAKEAIAVFSQYLRRSLVDFDSNALIPFADEMQHVKNYLRIESIRFGEKLRVTYDIRDTAFTIPPLALQTLVENAVRHGIEQKADGGTICITVRREEDGYRITVQDTGAGFDTEEVLPFHMGEDAAGRKHVGLYSTASRLKMLCGGSLLLESEKGKGATATILIPKRRSDD